MMSGFAAKQQNDISAFDHGQVFCVPKRRSPETVKFRVIACSAAQWSSPDSIDCVLIRKLRRS